MFAMRLVPRRTAQMTSMSASARACAAAAAVIAALCALAQVGAAADLDPSIRLQIDALLQEGGLLRDELERLKAPTQVQAAEGAQLDADEQSLRTASAALNHDIQTFN